MYFNGMNWFDYIINYWAQIFAIIGLLVGALKIWLDYRNKRLEIKYNLFYKEKMNYILKFYDNYFSAESVLRDYSGRATHKFLSAQELDKEVFPKLQALRSTFNYIQLLVNENEIAPFQQIMNNIDKAGKLLYHLNYRIRENDKDVNERVNNPIFYIESSCLSNKSYLLAISANTKTFFGM